MNDHPRESTLELFVLGSKTLTDADRDAIGRHLDRCAGCRALADRMGEFYSDLRAEVGNINQSTRPRPTS
jgi:predicted anti-sigma-YlaC factor YlaD